MLVSVALHLALAPPTNWKSLDRFHVITRAVRHYSQFLILQKAALLLQSFSLLSCLGEKNADKLWKIFPSQTL